MKIRLLCIGKMKNAHLKALVEDYTERMGHFASLEVVELRDGRAPDAQARLTEEARVLRQALESKGSGGFAGAVLWDEKGETLDTAKFSEFLERTARRGSTLTFVIGSSHGVDQALKREIPKHLRLSALTLTHEWARALALEQIYRAFCLLRGLPYHHG
jgi:23S rRNA (pseudouridine1915-N3)-methyltransferase